MARHMRLTRKELRRGRHPYADAVLGVALVIFLTGLLVALKAVLG